MGRRIARATRKDYDWELRLFDAKDTANAFCLPGGKIGVFSGILEFTRNDAGLAVVVSHEVAHAVLQHSNERMSQPALKQLIEDGSLETYSLKYFPFAIHPEKWGGLPK